MGQGFKDYKRIKIFQSLIEVSDIHADRLAMACKHINPLIPLKANDLETLSDEELGFSELLISRFGKLQDIIGAKIFPLLLQMINQKEELLGLLDILHQLEKMNFLPSSKKWIDMRELRNQFVHEYPHNPELMAYNLNKVFEAGQNLVDYWHFLKGKSISLIEQWIEEVGKEN